MFTIIVRHIALRRFSLGCGLLAVLFLAAGPASHASPPLQPLDPPLYSFDLQSPTVIDGLVGAADILEFAFPVPAVAVPGELLGLVSPLDDLDALSSHNDSVLQLAPFSLLFSVDRDTVGIAPPDPALVALAVPFNVLDQAQRGHAAGDQFMSLGLYMLGVPSGLDDGRGNNNAQVRNNFDEGGTSFSGRPPTSSYGTSMAQQDNTNATSLQPRTPLLGLVTDVYFSATRASPSLLDLPGYHSPSGANIFFNQNPLELTPTQLYAMHYELWLDMLDDIDGMIVFDFNRTGLFDEGDHVLFTLTPDSPSLGTIPGTSPTGAGADVLHVVFGGQPEVFALSYELGLGDDFDNLDALDYLFCEDPPPDCLLRADPIECARKHGIRLLFGDLNCDGEVDFGDINPFVLALSNPAGYAAAYPQCDIIYGDINEDGNVDFGDINPFVWLLTQP